MFGYFFTTVCNISNSSAWNDFCWNLITFVIRATYINCSSINILTSMDRIRWNSTMGGKLWWNPIWTLMNEYYYYHCYCWVIINSLNQCFVLTMKSVARLSLITHFKLISQLIHLFRESSIKPNDSHVFIATCSYNAIKIFIIHP